MDIRRKRLLVFGVLIGSLLIGIGIMKTPKLKPSPIIKAEDITPLLKDGDVICRLGDRLWS
jgi:hypothetical protein